MENLVCTDWETQNKSIKAFVSDKQNSPMYRVHICITAKVTYVLPYDCAPIGSTSVV